jgi:hypothetical protein
VSSPVSPTDTNRVTPHRAPRHRPHRRTFGTAAALALVVSLAGPAAADQVSELSTTLSTARGEKERLSAAMQLARLKDARGLRPLVAALGDRSTAVRAVAAGGLGVLGDPAALPALRRLAADPDRVVRRRALEAIAALRGAPGSGARLGGLAPASLEAPAPTRPTPSLFVVMKSANDKTAGAAGAEVGRQRADQVRGMLLRELGDNQLVTLESTTASELGIEPYELDVAIVKLERGVRGPFVEVACELRVAISDRRGRMISFVTGGAKVQVPRKSFRGEHEPRMRVEALENAVKSVQHDLVSYLAASRPS